jgi:hypothetical protein
MNGYGKLRMKSPGNLRSVVDSCGCSTSQRRVASMSPNAAPRPEKRAELDAPTGGVHVRRDGQVAGRGEVVGLVAHVVGVAERLVQVSCRTTTPGHGPSPTGGVARCAVRPGAMPPPG